MLLLTSTSLMVTLEIIDESFLRRMVRTVAGEGFEKFDETLATSSAESVANATPPRLTRPVEVSTETEAPARRSGGGAVEESSRVSSRSRGIERERGVKRRSRVSLSQDDVNVAPHFSFSFPSLKKKTKSTERQPFLGTCRFLFRSPARF